MAGSPLKRLLPPGGCKGTTKKGLSCQSKDVFENGYCKHHGGKGESLVSRRQKLAVELALKRAARFNRRMARWERKHPELRRLREAVQERRRLAKAVPELRPLA